MDLDDIPVGRVLSRREALAFLGASSTLLFFGCSSSADATAPITANSSCLVRPELTEGPYYVDEELNRSDIRSDPSSGAVQDGALLALTFNVSSAGSNVCTPLANAVVDVWHCNAVGVYSDVSDHGFRTAGQKFLRGYQVTGSDGVARFTTIYPGWYQGRAVHIHFKVRSSGSSSSAYEFTSQLFFDDSLTDQVHAQQPYASNGQRDLRNAQDGIYQQGGSQLVLNVSQIDQGYAATFDVALDNS
ncbi:MAG TPA: intradiol ring-cleavage dioxygenase [Gemmatimonadales bacterium]